MAMTSIGPQTIQRPRWPDLPFDPARAYLYYDGIADELVLYFGPEPVAAVSDLIDAPEGDDAAVMVGLGPDGEETGEVVGIHVYPLLVGAARQHPAWRRLAEPDPPAELVAGFVVEVRDLFAHYWQPAPPIEEQLAALRHASPEA